MICLANAGDDTSNCLKQAHEFGIPQSGVRLAGLVMQDYIVKSIGLDTAQGLVGVMPWCWNMNAAAGVFADRFSPLYHDFQAELLSCWHLLGGDPLSERRGGAGCGQG